MIKVNNVTKTFDGFRALDGLTMTVEQRLAPDGKPKDRSYLEKDLPASLQKALDEYIQGEKNHVSYMDCLWGELYGAINSNQWSNVITMEQAACIASIVPLLVLFIVLQRQFTRSIETTGLVG